jgi:hypothetical protein
VEEGHGARPENNQNPILPLRQRLVHDRLAAWLTPCFSGAPFGGSAGSSCSARAEDFLEGELIESGVCSCMLDRHADEVPLLVEIDVTYHDPTPSP